MSNTNSSNNPRQQPTFLQPTIATVPRTFDAQNRPPAIHQQQLSALDSGNNRRRNNNTNLTDTTDGHNNNVSNDDNDDDGYDDDDDDGIVVGTATGTFPITGSLDEQQQVAVIANWRERERRQRTIRVFMMFLLMLLLMEEEPNSSSIRHPKNRHNLRRAAGSSSSSSKRHDKLTLSNDVYSSRVAQDEHLRMLGRLHPRYHDLVVKEQQRSSSAGDSGSDKHRSDYDYNEKVVTYVLALADIGKDEFDSNSASSRITNTIDERTQGATIDDTTTTLKRNTGTSGLIGSSSRRGSGLIMPYLRDPEEDRKVYHYPWNATGFYRGSWKRITNAKQSKLFWQLPVLPKSQVDTKDQQQSESQQYGRVDVVDGTRTDIVTTSRKLFNETTPPSLDDDQNNSIDHNHRRLFSSMQVMDANVEDEVEGVDDHNQHHPLSDRMTSSVTAYSSSTKALSDNPCRTNADVYDESAISSSAIVTRPTKLTVTNTASTSNSDTNKTNNVPGAKNGSSSVGTFVSAVDMEHHMMSILHRERMELFGVHLLPFGYRLLTRDDNNLTTSRHEEIRYDQAGNKFLPPPETTADAETGMKVTKVRSRFGFSNPSTTASGGATTQSLSANEQDNTAGSSRLLPVTLTLDSGRAAFQLFSRSIPAMKELSLVEGFIKLYDSPSQGYSTKKDLLLRVRGVLIHSIGRLSLTANADISRAAFVMVSEIPSRPSQLENTQLPRSTGTTSSDKERNINQHDNSSLKDSYDAESSVKRTNLHQHDENGDTDHLRTKDQRHRRLQWAVKDLLHSSKIASNTVEEIRDEAIQLFGNEGKDEHNHNSRWTLLATAPEVVDETIEAASKMFTDVEDIKQLNSDEVENSTSIGQSVTNSSIDDDHAVPAEDTVKERRLLSRKMYPPKIVPASTIKDIDTAQNNSSSEEVTKDHDGPTNAKELPPWSDLVLPFPYFKDDEDESIRRARTPASSQMTETWLEANAAHCLFEINMDVEPVQWTVGSWRKLINYHVALAKVLDPEAADHDDEVEATDKKDNAEGKEETTGEARKRRIAMNGGKRRVFETSKSAYTKSGRDQALVVRMVGQIMSPNCDFASELNVTALRTDWDATTSKAISYSFYMMLVCLTQILILLRQLLHSQSNATATRVSILCIGWQTVIDALLCLAHIYLSLAMQPLFTAFASVAFFKLLIFCVIEMKYMAIILQARNSSNGGQPIEVLRRQVAILHLRFYVSLMVIFIALLYVNDKYRLPYILALYSFWVPQIVLNIITEAKAPMHKYYIYGMSLTRLVVPLYMLAFPGNFLRQVYPDPPTDVFTCEMVVLWIGIQTAVLIAQGHYGARFMIPARFLPPKFDYSRPLPASMLPPGADTAILLYEQTHFTGAYDPKAPSSSPSASTSATSSLSSATTNDSDAQHLRLRHNTTATTTRMRGNRQNRNPTANATQEYSTSGRHPSLPTSSHTSPTSNEAGKLIAAAPSILPPPPCCLMECSICYDEIDIRKRKDYMLAPCNHLFHRPCLSQWMDVKMECPICRTELPAL